MLRKRSESEAKMTGGGSSRVKDIPVDIFTARPEDGLGGGAPRGRPAREKVRGNNNRGKARRN